MQQNIKNEEEKLQEKKQRMRRQENVNQNQEQGRVNFSNIQQIKQYKTQYFSLFLMLLEVIITTVVIVLFITLGYVGFVGWGQNQASNKISLQSLPQCGDEYMVRENDFIVTKIKTAFIFLCVQFGVAFSCVVAIFILVVKIVKTQRIRRDQSYKNIKPTLTLINILLSIGIILCVILFGTYLNFYIQENSNKITQQCRLNIIDREILPIIILLGIKLAIFLIVWSLMLRQIILINNQNSQLMNQNLRIQQNNDNKNKVYNSKFPQIHQLRSVLQYHYPQQRKINPVNKGNPQDIMGTNDQDNFKPLKTEDFLLQLKNNQTENDQLRLYMIKDKVKKTQKFIDPIIEDADTNRRLMIYEPQDHQIIIQTKKDLNKQIKNNKQSLQGSKRGKNHDEFSLYSSMQKDQNMLLLIHSVNRGPTIEDLGMLPQNSKRKSINQVEQQKAIQRKSIKLQRKYSLEDKKNFPPRSQKKDVKIEQSLRSKKNIFSSQTIKIVQNRNNLIGSDRESLEEIRSIIMKLESQEGNEK